MTAQGIPGRSRNRRIGGDPPAWIFAGLLLYTISVYTALGERIQWLAAIRHELLLGTAMAILCIWVILKLPLPIGAYRSIVVAIVALFISMLTQVPFAADRQLAWNTFFDRIIKQALFAFFIATLIRSPRYLRFFMAAFLFSLFWVYQEAVRGLITGALVWYNQGIERLHGAVVLYGHPNGLSLIAVTCLPFVIFLQGQVRNRLLRIALLATAGLALLCIIYTGSRAGYVGTLAVLSMWWLMSGNKIRGAVLALLLGVATLVAMPGQYKERFLSIGGEEKEGHSKEARLLLMSDAWQIFLDNPLGVGLNSFEYVRYVRYGRGQDTHNLYLQVATHIGVQGLLVFGFFVGSLLHALQHVNGRLKRLLHRAQGLYQTSAALPGGLAGLRDYLRDVQFTRAVSRAVLMYMGMLLVNGVFAHSLYLICWWLCSGLAMSMLNITGKLEKECDRRMNEVGLADRSA